MRLYTAAVFLAGCAGGPLLQANPVYSPCVANTLAAYEQMRGESLCAIGILDFGYFDFSSSPNAALNAANIELTPIANGSLGGGFTISPVNPATQPFAVTQGQSATYDIDWRFIIDPGPVASGADIGMDPPFGNVTISQAYCLDGVFGTPNTSSTCQNPGSPNLPTPTLQTLMVNDTNPPGSWTEHKDFNPPATVFGSVLTTINLDGTNGPAGFDSVTGVAEVTDMTATAPEPATWALTAGFMLGMTLLRIKLSSKSKKANSGSRV